MAEVMRELVAVWRLVPQRLAEWVHEWVLRQHAPVEVQTGPSTSEAFCTNHWRPRVRSWPCAEYVREVERWDARNA